MKRHNNNRNTLCFNRNTYVVYSYEDTLSTAYFGKLAMPKQQDVVVVVVVVLTDSKNSMKPVWIPISMDVTLQYKGLKMA